MTNLAKTPNSLMKIFAKTFVILPVPLNISTMWSFGSLLSICLAVQIASGLLLASAYSANLEASFSLVAQVMESTDKGWLIRNMHANGASLFFACLYSHVARGLYYGSFVFTPVWASGVTTLIALMATAFMGYVLPASQMSFWGASVITNLFSEVPYLGPSLVQFIWGGSSVGSPTVMRFFTFHFFLPFAVSALVAAHITFLHETGSNNPLGLSSATSKVSFNPFLAFKDLLGVVLLAFLLFLVVFCFPLALSEQENFKPADPSSTPSHIQPEWYFLFAYAILRSVPSKLGGVLALLLSVLVLYAAPLTFLGKMKGASFYPISMLLFWGFTVTVLMLTWIGARPVSEPYTSAGPALAVAYFSYFAVAPLSAKLWDTLTG